MNDFLGSMVSRSFTPSGAVRPRLASRFEPVAPEPASVAAEVPALAAPREAAAVPAEHLPPAPPPPVRPWVAPATPPSLQEDPFQATDDVATPHTPASPTPQEAVAPAAAPLAAPTPKAAPRPSAPITPTATANLPAPGARRAAPPLHDGDPFAEAALAAGEPTTLVWDEGQRPAPTAPAPAPGRASEGVTTEEPPARRAEDRARPTRSVPMPAPPARRPSVSEQEPPARRLSVTEREPPVPGEPQEGAPVRLSPPATRAKTPQTPAAAQPLQTPATRAQAQAQQTSPAPAQATPSVPTVQVTIGRIDVRATPAPAAQPRREQRAGPSLEEYLRRRSQGGDR